MSESADLGISLKPAGLVLGGSWKTVSIALSPPSIHVLWLLHPVLGSQGSARQLNSVFIHISLISTLETVMKTILTTEDQGHKFSSDQRASATLKYQGYGWLKKMAQNLSQE